MTDSREDEFGAAVRRSRFRHMTAAQKLHLVERLWFDARKLKAAGLRAQHPDWSDEKIEDELREIFLNAGK